MRNGIHSVVIAQIHAVDRKIGAGKKRPYGSAEQECARYAVDDQECVVALFPEEIIRFPPKFVCDRLNNEYEQDQHPYVECTAETGAVKKRERGEKSTAERDQRGEREFPFPAERVDDHVTFLFGLADRVEQPLPSLDEEQENQQCAQQADQEPPIVL